jgi:outer membrane protein TolC
VRSPTHTTPASREIAKREMLAIVKAAYRAGRATFLELARARGEWVRAKAERERA